MGAVLLAAVSSLCAAPTHLVDEPVVSYQRLEDGTVLLDFGKVGFGNLRLQVPDSAGGSYRFLFGEAFAQGRIDRKPPGTVRYKTFAADLPGGTEAVLAPPPVGRHLSHAKAVKTPEDWGVVTPFRWVEIEGWDGVFKPEWVVRQTAYLQAWEDEAAYFESSDPLLNRIWELCKYSIKATTFAGIYVDGDRERIPYEADAYINQLSHYYTDADKQIARDTYDWLLTKSTWPTEWAPHMVFIAHADWMHTGEADWLKPRYEGLKDKLLLDRVGEDGWVRTAKQAQNGRPGTGHDIVDWPAGERNGYVFTAVNTVVNAFHLRAVDQMADLAEAVGRTEEAQAYRQRYVAGVARFNENLWMPEKGAYRDGLGTDHTAAHATLFPLAFGLVPEANRAAAVEFLKGKGMACSVYAAQYLMEGLFEHGGNGIALDLMTADGDRSWQHMVNSGTTISWEAWDQKYKPNQDWNHAWGAAPANLLPRYVLGVEPVEPGWTRTRIAPRTAGLQWAKGKVPTRLGPIHVAWKIRDGQLEMTCRIPEGTTAVLEFPEFKQHPPQELAPGEHRLQIDLDECILDNSRGHGI